MANRRAEEEASAAFRRVARGLAPFLIIAVGACASRPPAPTATRGWVPARPPVQQPASSRAVTTVPLPALTPAARSAASGGAAAGPAPASPPAGPSATFPPAPGAPMPPDDVVGRPLIYTARYEDTLLDLAMTNRLGFLEITAANPDVDPWLPGDGTPITLSIARMLPIAPRQGIVLNLPEQRLFLFEKGQLVDSFPIGVFRDGFSTPVGSTAIVRKVVDPIWYPPASAREDDPTLPAAVPPGPDNPLGTRAMYLGWPRYLIHSTHKPYGVGRRVSRGCIRMYPADAERLYDLVPIGTPVHVVNQPVKIGWWSGELFVQAHPTLQQGMALEETGRIEPIEVPDLRGRIEAKVGPASGRIDWPTVERALKERRGYPVQVTNVDRPIAALPSASTIPPAAASTALIR